MADWLSFEDCLYSLFECQQQLQTLATEPPIDLTSQPANTCTTSDPTSNSANHGTTAV